MPKITYERVSKFELYVVELQIPHCVYTEEKKKVIFGKLRKYLGQLFHELAKQKSCEIIEGHLMSDHVNQSVVPHEDFLQRNILFFNVY